MSLTTPRTIEIGQLYSITWRNGIEKKDGQIIEKRRLKKLSARLDASGTIITTEDEHLKQDDYEYYVHFPSFDRRLDEWVTIDRIDLYSAVNADLDHTNLKNKKNTSQKRRYSSTGGDETGDSTAAHAANDTKEKDTLLVSLEKEHEELTKVKNIQAIVLG